MGYILGFVKGFYTAGTIKDKEIALLKINFTDPRTSFRLYQTPAPQASATPKPKAPTAAPITWGGPELWEAVNARRKEFGVQALDQENELCTIASIRLNTILDLGKIDNHEGFVKLPDDRPELRPIFEKYVLVEFLVSGAETAKEAVSLWENTLAHKQLLTGGEYVWGCIYAQNGFAVAIAAY